VARGTGQNENENRKGQEVGTFDSYSDKMIRDAEGFGNAPYFDTPGRYTLRIVRHVLGTSKKSKDSTVKVSKFVIEFEVVEGGTEKHPEGSRRSRVSKMSPADENVSTKIGAMKAHFEAVSGTPQSEIDKEFLEAVENDPLKYEGILVRAEVLEKIKTKAGGDFTPMNWYPYDEEESEQSSPATVSTESAPF